MPYISIDDLKIAIEDYFKRLKFEYDKPLYKIGDRVKTKPDVSDSYISKVIGVGKEGIILTECSIPLVDFGDRIGTFYVCQEKLKLI